MHIGEVIPDELGDKFNLFPRRYIRLSDSLDILSIIDRAFDFQCEEDNSTNHGADHKERNDHLLRMGSVVDSENRVELEVLDEGQGDLIINYNVQDRGNCCAQKY